MFHIGQYNYTYLQEVYSLVQEASTYGIYSLLDMHQDCLSEHYCGEGVPFWAAESSGPLQLPSPFATPFNSSQYFTDNSTGIPYQIPTRQACAELDWSDFQATEAAATAYDALYVNKDGLRDKWGLFWQEVAKQFKDTPAKLGYELINEPFAGDVYSDPLLFIPGIADKQRLQPAYDAIAPGIRSVDADGLIFFAGTTWDDIGVGFDHVPGGSGTSGNGYENRSVLAYHYYEPPQFSKSEVFDIEVRIADAKRLQSGLMLTEFPAPGYADDIYRNMTQDADQFGQSWIIWELKDWCRETDATRNGPSQNAAWGACKTGFGGGMYDANTQQMIPYMRKELSRTYATAVAGNQTFAQFNPDTGVYQMTFLVDTNIPLPTEVYFSQSQYYTNGYNVQVVPQGSLIFSLARTNLLYFTHTDIASFGQSISITITPI
jgi:endoglycosylceramidase